MRPCHVARYGSPESRFWNSVSPEPNTGCWLWTGSDDNGYGCLGVNGRRVRAHRYSWELAHGAPPPADMHVCHRCDQPACVNPDHLFLGDDSANMRDCGAKGRLWAQRKDIDRSVLGSRWSQRIQCERGHPFTVENTRWFTKNGYRCRECLECSRIRHREGYARLKARAALLRYSQARGDK